MVMRLTKPTERVLALLLGSPTARTYGMELIDNAKVSAGTLYPMLTRLEKIGWLTSEWEHIDPSEAGRPARRYYSLTGTGRIEAATALDRKKARGLDGLAEA